MWSLFSPFPKLPPKLYVKTT